MKFRGKHSYRQTSKIPTYTPSKLPLPSASTRTRTRKLKDTNRGRNRPTPPHPSWTRTLYYFLQE